MPRRDVLCYEFAELLQFDEGGGGVVAKIPLRQRAEAGETIILVGEEIEVAGQPHGEGDYSLRRPFSIRKPQHDVTSIVLHEFRTTADEMEKPGLEVRPAVRTPFNLSAADPEMATA